jgi:hypothetical protein
MRLSLGEDDLMDLDTNIAPANNGTDISYFSCCCRTYILLYGTRSYCSDMLSCTHSYCTDSCRRKRLLFWHFLLNSLLLFGYSYRPCCSGISYWNRSHTLCGQFGTEIALPAVRDVLPLTGIAVTAISYWNRTSCLWHFWLEYLFLCYVFVAPSLLFLLFPTFLRPPLFFSLQLLWYFWLEYLLLFRYSFLLLRTEMVLLLVSYCNDDIHLTAVLFWTGLSYWNTSCRFGYRPNCCAIFSWSFAPKYLLQFWYFCVLFRTEFLRTLVDTVMISL